MEMRRALALGDSLTPALALALTLALGFAVDGIAASAKRSKLTWGSLG